MSTAQKQNNAFWEVFVERVRLYKLCCATIIHTKRAFFLFLKTT
jgi:hypothetical protein